MDTGSSDLWVPSTSCRSSACKDHQSLGPSDSTSLQQSTTQWQIQYGSGAAAGVLVSDMVSIGGLTVTRMPFGVVTQLTSNFAQFVRKFIKTRLIVCRFRTGFWGWHFRRLVHKVCQQLWINLYFFLTRDEELTIET